MSLSKDIAKINQLIEMAPAVPPSYSQSLKKAIAHMEKAKFALDAAEMILLGGTPVPEELKNG